MSVSPGQGHIRRGPIAAEVLGQQFTQMGNQAARDQRLTRRAKGLLVELLSHRDGYGISVSALVAAGPEGRDAIRSTLKELEEHGYLRRVQTRDGQGRIGDTVYWITDMPEGSASQTEKPRSAPAPEKPAPDSPAPVNPPHKKTIPLQEDHSVEDEISLPPLPAPRSEPNPVHERETSSSIKPSTPQQLLRAAGVVAADEEEAFTAWVVATHKPRSTAWWRTVAANGDLPDLAAQWRATGGRQPLTGADAKVSGWLALADQLAAKDGHQSYRDNVWDDMRHQLASGSRPDGWERYPHCGHPDCDPVTRGREVEDGSGLKSLTWCTACHPNMQF